MRTGNKIKRIIYDFGANNGDNLPYYLLKADLVVAVEANPALCEIIKSRFPSEISEKKLIVLNYVLTTLNKFEKNVDFYIHKKDHVRSQFLLPENLTDFDKVALPSIDVLSIIETFGQPFYIKIDLEHYDQFILKELFLNNIFPPYISAESLSIEVFATMVALGGYQAFKLVDGETIHSRYVDRKVITRDGEITHHSFNYHSAGPFGSDIDGPWMTAECIFRSLAFSGLGWKDIHATNIEKPDLNYSPNIQIKLSVDI